MPWRYQICIAKFLFSYKDDLPESFNQTTPNDAKSPLPVDDRCLRTMLLKLPNLPYHQKNKDGKPSADSTVLRSFQSRMK